MAADPEPDWLSCLPSAWSHGVTRDGRIFFINEEAKSSTWLHPGTGEAVSTGHRKTPDLPTGWEEGYTFEGARCFINHNERKVTCKHPVSNVPSQDNCIFVVNEQPALKPSSEQGSGSDKKERPMSTMSEASNYTGGSDYSTFPGSPSPAVRTPPTTSTSTSSTRPSRSSKKIHNFGKRSNSIKRNPNAPVVRSSWLYKQDSTGMKLWKKRWFVLSDMCLFYYRDEKEDSVLGSILLPSFHISMLSVDDHISRKYAFKATHPNMRTYYFCTDSAKDMESWMKVMTDAALVHGEPVRRLEKLTVDQRTPQELNNLLNHRVLTRPEIQNNERNREPLRQHSLSRVEDKRQKDGDRRQYYTLQRDGGRYSLKKDGVSYLLQRDGERFLLHKDGDKFLLRKDGDKFCLHKDGDVSAIQRDLEKYAVQKVDEKYNVAPSEEKYAPSKDGEKFLLTKDGEKFALQKVGERHALQKDVQKYVPHKDVKRQLSLKETTDRYADKYGTVHVVDKYGTVKEVKKYSTLREGNKYAAMRDAEKYATLRDGDKYATLRDGDKYGFQRDAGAERTLTKISSIKLQPAQAAAIAAAVSASRQGHAAKPAQVNGSGAGETHGDGGATEVVDNSLVRVPAKSPGPGPSPVPEAERGGLSRTGSMQQLEHWVRSQRTRGLDEDTRSVTSYQTLPRNMPSHRAQIVPRYPEGYRTLPRNGVMRPDSVCGVAGSAYDRALRPASTSAVTAAEKRRSMRDDTMWQLYEWQQRQAFSRQSLAPPTAVGHYGTLPSTKTMGNISEHAVVPSIPASPSHGTLALYSTFSPPPQQQQGVQHGAGGSRSEVSSPIFRGDATLDRRHRAHLAKYGYPPERRSIAAAPGAGAGPGAPPPAITAQSLQGKTPEELTLLLIKLRRQQAELNSLREHTLAQLMALGLEGPNAKVPTDDFKDGPPIQRTEEVDVDTKLSRLCEQDQCVRLQEEKLQQLHREKHTLEAALLSASQELSETDGAANQSLIQQRDVLQSGLLSTCRELGRVHAELQRSWTDYDRLEADVTLAKSNLLEQLEALGSPQTEPPSQRHIQIQKELWRIQDVMEALNKNKPPRSSDSSSPGSTPLSSQQKNEAPDYRLYKSEPELTTVKEEVDEAPHDDKDRTERTEPSAESKDPPSCKAPPYPVGVVPPRTRSPMGPPESSTIASYVTLRKTKKPESRTDRPHSAVDQVGVVEREVGRTRMSVEEQLERIRRNQEASSLREKKREAPSRSPSFSREKPAPAPEPAPVPVPQGRGPAEGACADPLELEAALQQLKVAHLEQSRAVRDRAWDRDRDQDRDRDREADPAADTAQEAQRAEQEEKSCSHEVLQEEQETAQAQTDGRNSQLADSHRVVFLDLAPEPRRVDADVSSSPTTNTTENSFQTPEAQTPEAQTPSPEPKDEDPPRRGESPEKSLESYRQLTGDDKKLNNNNNLLASQTFTLVSSDT